MEVNDKKSDVDLSDKLEKGTKLALAQIKKKLNRCQAEQCNKKLTLVMQSIGKCPCGGVFCNSHRFPNDHNCAFDHVAKEKEILRRRNPVITVDHFNRV